MTPDQVIRFEAKFVRQGPEECWVWTAALDAQGYGKFRLNGKPVLAHRVAFQLKNGPIEGELCILHRCDNPSCVNPGHLFVGTKGENVADMIAKNRQAKGEAKTNAKLTEADVLAIRDDPRVHREIAQWIMVFTKLWLV